MNAVYISLGGFVGAILRFLTGEWLQTKSGFPLGTLIVNLIGCLLLGWFLAIAKRKNIKDEYILFGGTGFISSFTTFSTFSVETISLIENTQYSYVLLYILVTIIIGILFSYLGFKLGSKPEAKGETL